MKWIEFGICIFWDLTLIVYFIVGYWGDMDVKPFAVVVYVMACILCVIGTKVTYKELKEGF